MKIAYLITAYGQYAHLRRLIAALDGPDAHFFIHIDARSPDPGDLGGSDNITLIPRRRVWWGGWSHTAAILDLMRAAAPGDWDYCSVMSGGDYPLRPTAQLHRILTTGGEFINLREGFRPDKPEKRLKYYFFDGFDRRLRTPKVLFMRAAELALRPLVHKRRYPFEKVYMGTIWSVLSMGCVRHILQYADSHPEYVKFFRTALVPEESFFHTIIGNSPYLGRVRSSLTYTDWSDPAATGPAMITMEHLDRLATGHPAGWATKEYDPFFARKFDDASADVVAAIDRRFR